MIPSLHQNPQSRKSYFLNSATAIPNLHQNLEDRKPVYTTIKKNHGRSSDAGALCVSGILFENNNGLCFAPPLCTTWAVIGWMSLIAPSLLRDLVVIANGSLGADAHPPSSHG
jgi:hypothetical protein